MNNSVTSDYLNDRTTKLIVSAYFRKSERLLCYSLIDCISKDIKSITLSYVGNQFMLYRGSHESEWQIKHSKTPLSSQLKIANIKCLIRLHPKDLCATVSILSIDSLPFNWERLTIRLSITCQQTNHKMVCNKEFKKSNWSPHELIKLPLNQMKNHKSISNVTLIISVTILRIIRMKKNLRSLHSKKRRITYFRDTVYDEPYAIGKYWIEDLLVAEPALHTISNAKDRETLFIKKLHLCCITFNFNTVLDRIHETAKETKRKYLLDLVEYMSQLKKSVSEDSIPVILEMVSTNIFRSLPPSIYEDIDFDPEQDEPSFDPSWPHLQFLYEFVYHFMLNADVRAIRRYIHKQFLLNLIHLFNSEDPRERDYLKLILHRLYGRCMPLRSFIRKSINNALHSVIYSDMKHNGISELFEILGSIINGFTLPLKNEHLLFFKNILIPMHKISFLSQFHEQILYCIVQFVHKDESLSLCVINGLLRFWPKTSSKKELLFLKELETVLAMTGIQQVEHIMEPLFNQIAKSMCSMNFQVAERTLLLWNNDNIATITTDCNKQILPIIYPSLQKNCRHWNSSVASLTLNIIRILKEIDNQLYAKVAKHYTNKQKR